MPSGLPWDLMTILLTLPGGVPWRLVDAFASCLVTGQVGAGKSTAIGMMLLDAVLAIGAGGLGCCVKSDERAVLEARALRHGRPVRVMEPGGRWTLNILDSIARSAGKAGVAADIVAALTDIYSGVGGGSGMASDDGENAFFAKTLKLLLVNTVELILLAELVVSVPLMRVVVSSAAVTPGQVEEAEWRAKSECWQLLQEADAHITDAELRHDYDEVSRFWLSDWPNLSDRTKSVVIVMFAELCRPFVMSPLRQLFSGETTVRMEETIEDGVFLIPDIPIQGDFREAGKAVQIALKWLWGHLILKRSGPPGTLRPSVLYCDEAPALLVERDVSVQAVLRGAGGIGIFLAQGFDGIRRALGSEDSANSFCYNLASHWHCRNVGFSAEWASRTIGERHLKVPSMSLGRSESPGSLGPHASAGTTFTETKRRYLEPIDFSKLACGGDEFDRVVECIYFGRGKWFKSADGELVPFQRVKRRQE
jgi:hypothetical protein